EGFRWFDIRRWKIASKVLDGPIYAPAFNGDLSNAKPTIDENWCSRYDGTTWDGQPMNLRTYATAEYISPKNDLWPIPEAEMTAAHLRQNDGY
ncbi:MAG: RagB/SusD family nutrient uptake outer membrane protein, partial [Alistipes sp.]